MKNNFLRALDCVVPLLLIAMTFVQVACNGPQSSTGSVNDRSAQSSHNDSAAFRKLIDRYYEASLTLDPVSATWNGDNRFNDQFPNYASEAYLLKSRSFYQKYLDSLTRFDRSTLSEGNRITYDVLDFDLKNDLKGLTYKENLEMPINQINSMALIFPQMGSAKTIEPFKTVKDYEDFLKRIEGFRVYIDTVIGRMRQGIRDGYVLPKALVVKMIPQMKSFVVSNPLTSVFYGPVTAMPASFSTGDKDRLTKAYVAAISDAIIPSYKKLSAFLNDVYLPRARTTAGVLAFPNGKEYYAYCIHNFTTTDLSSDSIFHLGLSQVAQIRKGMDSIRKAVGYTGDLASFLVYIRTDKKFKPFKTDKEILARYQAIYNKEKPNLLKHFGRQPKTKFEIRKTEAFRAASAPAGEYWQGTPDGSRPGIFYTVILDPTTYLSPEMETLFLHEAIPGHHFQISLQNENTSLPLYRRFYGNSAFAEGWALYAESLGNVLGEYTDPYELLGHMGDDIHRAIRLVVDVGMHAKGWTREKAIKYMLDNEPTSEHDATVEIERYMAWPGQALSYKIGQLTIKGLREKYRNQMGSKFSISNFHDEVLRNGALPLEVFVKHMDEWASKQK